MRALGHVGENFLLTAIGSPRCSNADVLAEATQKESGSARAVSDGLQLLIEQLRTVQHFLDTRAERLQSGHNVMHAQPNEGLNKLPNELLSHILCCAANPGPSRIDDPSVDAISRGALAFEADVLRLSHVNRRFLHVARSTSALWTTITQLQPLGMVQAFLQRSGMCGLRVVQIDGNGGVRGSEMSIRAFQGAIAAVLQHAPRLEFLKLRAQGQDQEGAVYKMIVNADWHDFPRLVELDVFCPFVEEFYVDMEPLILGTLLDGGRFPSLRSLCIPDYMLEVCAIKGLTSLSLIGLQDHLVEDLFIPVEDIITTLSHLPELRSFSLRLEYDRDDVVILSEPEGEPIVIPGIQHLQFYSATPITNSFVENFLGCVCFPGLETLALHLSAPRRFVPGDIDTIFSVIYSLGSDLHSFPQLHTLKLFRSAYVDHAMDTENIVDGAADRRMLARMPGLRDISLLETIPKHTLSLLGVISDAEQPCILPLLERVSLHNCDYLRGEHIQDAVVSRQNVPRIQPLKHLEIKNCRLINAEDRLGLEAAMKESGGSVLLIDHF